MSDSEKSSLSELVDEHDREFREELGFDPDERPDDRPELDRRIDYLLGQLRELRAEIEHEKAVAAKRHEDIDRWLGLRTAMIENRVTWTEGKIRSLSHGYDFGRKKSRRLPNGRFGWRAGSDTVDIVDNAKAVAFARARGLDVKETTKVYVKTLVGHVKSTGEEPDLDSDGFRLIPGVDSFFISPEDPDE